MIRDADAALIGGRRERRLSLLRSDGAAYLSVEAVATPQGGLVVRRHESGPSPQDAWGAHDREATLEITPEHVAKLALVLLEAGLSGQADALERLGALCERNDIPCRRAIWT
jgi:hypothetical protein